MSCLVLGESDFGNGLNFCWKASFASVPYRDQIVLTSWACAVGELARGMYFPTKGKFCNAKVLRRPPQTGVLPDSKPPRKGVLPLCPSIFNPVARSVSGRKARPPSFARPPRPSAPRLTAPLAMSGTAPIICLPYATAPIKAMPGAELVMEPHRFDKRLPPVCGLG